MGSDCSTIVEAASSITAIIALKVVTVDPENRLKVLVAIDSIGSCRGLVALHNRDCTHNMAVRIATIVELIVFTVRQLVVRMPLVQAKL